MNSSIKSLLKEYDLRNIAKNKKARQVGALYISLFLTLFIGIAISVINTRLLGPKLYGDFRFLMNLFNFLFPFLTLGFFVSGARLIAQKKNEAIKPQLMGTLLSLALIMAAVLMVFVFVFSFFEDRLFHNELGWILRLFVPLIFVFPVQRCLENIMQGDNRIYELSILRIGPSLLFLSGIVLYNHFVPLTLIPALAIRIMSILVIVVISVIVLKPAFRYFKQNLSVIREENKTYGFHVYIGVLAGVVSGQLGGLTIGYFLDTTNVGFFSLACTISMPMMMIPSAVGTTFFKSFADKVKISHKVITLTMILSIGSLTLFLLFIKKVFLLLYPADFAPAVSLAYYVAIAKTFNGLGDFFNRFLGAHGKGKELRNGAFVVGLSNVLGYILLVHLIGVKGAALTMLISRTMYFSMMLYYYVYYRKQIERERNTDFVTR